MDTLLYGTTYHTKAKGTGQVETKVRNAGTMAWWLWMVLYTRASEKVLDSHV